MYYDNNKDADVELENEPFLAIPKMHEPGLDDGVDEPTAFRISLYIGAIILLSLSCFASIYVSLSPRAPIMEPSKIFPELLYSEYCFGLSGRV